MRYKQSQSYWSRTHVGGRFFTHFSFPSWLCHTNVVVAREMSTNTKSEASSSLRMMEEFLSFHSGFFSSRLRVKEDGSLMIGRQRTRAASKESRDIEATTGYVMDPTQL